MKILIFALIFSWPHVQNVWAKEIDWKKLNNEMQFLKQHAFIPQEEKINPPHEESSLPEETPQTLSLQRKPKINSSSTDPNILPIEKEFFDNIEFDEVKSNYAAPKRKAIRVNGTLPKEL